MLKHISILMIICTSYLVQAQQTEIKQNTIIVTGSIEIKEIANEASLDFSVKGFGESLRNAVEDAAKKTKDITDKLLQTGLKRSDITTSDFTSGENYGDKPFLSSSKDYKANIKILIKTDSLDLLTPVLFLLSEQNVDNLSDITFSYKNSAELKRRARIEALKKAKEKAEDIGSILGITIGKAIYVEEILPAQIYSKSSQRYPNPFNNVISSQSMLGEADMDESKGSGFFAQTISVSNQVKVIFSIE